MMSNEDVNNYKVDLECNLNDCNLIERVANCRQFLTVHRTTPDEMDYLFAKKKAVENGIVIDDFKF